MSESDVCSRQIPTYKDSPRAERNKQPLVFMFFTNIFQRCKGNVGLFISM